MYNLMLVFYSERFIGLRYYAPIFRKRGHRKPNFVRQVRHLHAILYSHMLNVVQVSEYI